MALLTVFGLLVAAVPATVAYSFTVNFETEPFTTTFSVTTNTEQLNFSAFAGEGIVEPEGQGNSWGIITNDANQALNFSVKLDSLPDGITLKMGCSDGTIGGCGLAADLIDVSTTAAYPVGWTNVPYTDGDTDDVYIVAKADYGTSSTGLQTKTVTIESAVPP